MKTIVTSISAICLPAALANRHSWLLRLTLTALLALFLAGNVVATDKPAKMANVQGRVHMLDKNTSGITVEMKGGLKRQVTFGSDTKFMYGHSKNAKPGSADLVKENNYISAPVRTTTRWY